MKIAFWLKPACAAEPQNPIVVESMRGTVKHIYRGYMVNDMFVFHSRNEPAIEEWQNGVLIGENWMCHNVPHRASGEAGCLPCDTYRHDNGQIAEIRFAQDGAYHTQSARRYTRRGELIDE